MPNKNTKKLSIEERKLLSEKLRAVLGFHFPEARFEEMERRLEASLPQLPAGLQEAGLAGLINADWNQKIIDALVPNLSTGETYFFRDPLLWQYVETELIPFFNRQLNSGRRQNIYTWSAGCCTGEEPFTLAIMFQRFLTNEKLNRFPIFASDVSKLFLQQAQLAQYSTWSMRATPAEIKNQFFKIEANKFKLSESIVSMVRFFYYNLLDAQKPPNFPANGLDLIFCRNVLIYFDTTQSLQVVEKLASYLNEDGYLILSPHDIGIAQQSNVEVLSYIDNALLCKQVSSKLQNLAKTSDPSAKNTLPVLQAIEKNSLSKSSTQPASYAEISTVSAVDGNGTASTKKMPASIKAAELAREGKYEAAAETLKAHVKTEQCSDEDRKLLIQCYCNTGDKINALACCVDAIRHSPLQPVFYYLKASLEEDSGKQDAAAKTLQQALFLEPKFIIAHYALYNNYRKNGKVKQAQIAVRNILNLLDELDSSCELPESDGITAGQLRAIIKATG